MNKEDIKVSLVVPCYNEEKNIEKFIKCVEKSFENKILNYEIIFVNDGSKDNTLNEMQ